MQTAETGYTVVLDPKAYEGIDLIESDGVPMDSIWHRDCMYLLIDVTAHHCRERDDYFVGGNNFIYFNPDQARNLDYRGPDYFYMKNGVDRAKDRQFWAVWEENGRLPDVIIELLSHTTEREDRTTKFRIYEQTLKTPEYFMYDPDTERLEGFRLTKGKYVPIVANEKGWLWSKQLELWLGTWKGEYLGARGLYLRFYTKDGDLVLSHNEAAELSAERAKQREKDARRKVTVANKRLNEEKARADAAEQELARLREILRRRGDDNK